MTKPKTGYAPTRNGNRLYFTDTNPNAEQTLVFLHAGVSTHGMWDEQVKAFGADYRVLTYDLRGAGKSANPIGEFRQDEELLDLLKHAEVQNPVLIGASYGGKVVIDFVLNQAAEVRGVALVCAALGGYDFDAETEAAMEAVDALYEASIMKDYIEAELDMWVQGYDRPGDVDPAVRKRAKELMKEMVMVMPDAGETIAPPKIAKQHLNEIQAPTLVIQGAYDLPAFRDLSAYLAESIANARLESLPTAHLPSLEAPELFNEKLGRFLDGLQ